MSRAEAEATYPSEKTHVQALKKGCHHTKPRHVDVLMQQRSPQIPPKQEPGTPLMSRVNRGLQKSPPIRAGPRPILLGKGGLVKVGPHRFCGEFIIASSQIDILTLIWGFDA